MDLATAFAEAGLRVEFETWATMEEDFDFKRGPGSFGLTIGHKP